MTGRPHLRSVLLIVSLIAAAVSHTATAQPPFGMADEEGYTPEVAVEVHADVSSLSPGGQAVIAVVLDHSEGWHSWPAAHVELDPELEKIAIRTTIDAASDGPVEIGPTQWPDTKLSPVPDFNTGGTVDAPTYAGRAVAFVPVLIAESAEPGGEARIVVTVGFQACDDATCLPPEEVEHTLTLPIVAVTAGQTGGGDEGAGNEPPAGRSEDFDGFDPRVFSNADAWDQPRTGASGDDASTDSRGLFAILLLAGGAALGGFVLNLTPCVLPVIPMKIMTISSHANHPGKSLMLGGFMAVGVVAFWAALGVLASSFAAFADPTRLFGYWWFPAGIGLLIVVMGVGIMGAFNISLPQSVYAVNPTADSPHGSFLFGVMTAVLGLPCFGFVAGALLAGAATMPWWLVMTIFTCLGIGMAAPYLVLSANPNWISKVPKTGPASDLVKQVMGLLMIAAGAFFLGSGALAFLGSNPDWQASTPWWGKVVHWWVVALFALAAGGWLLWRTLQLTKSAPARSIFALTGLVLASGGVFAAVNQSAKAKDDFWVPYTAEVLGSGLSENKVVVLDFTAEWCLNCKALEAAVLLVEPVKGQLLAGDVLPLKADLTSTAAPGWDKLKELGRTGIPTLAIFGPGLEEPWIQNAYTSGEVMEAIEAARGGEADPRARSRSANPIPEPGQIAQSSPAPRPDAP